MLTPGARVGPYEVRALIGRGGMGEVYRGHDPRLGRGVAIKILPDSFAHDPERLLRFDREARSLAALNHPHIAQIYGLEEGTPSVLIMELVEGETLAEHVARGPMPLADAVPIARQIAAALEAAHDRGIIHRDLKPANIKLQPDGTVKVLDFGLAKSLTPDGGPPLDKRLMDSPTVTSPAVTMHGVILGTAAYMSPEQARGKPVDQRSDVWAFGVVLWEMLTGRRLFGGDDTTAVLAQILEREPDWSALPAHTPESVRRLLRRCLVKDRTRRLRDCGDAALELSDVALGEPAPVRAPSRPGRLALVCGVMGLVVGGLSAWLAPWRAQDSASPHTAVSRFALLTTIDSRAQGRPSLTISPDGRFVVYADGEQLLLRLVGELTPHPISGTERVSVPAGVRGNSGVAVQPMLSPDGAHVAYFQAGDLKRVAVTGGVPSTVCACGDALGATWGEDDYILYGRGTPSGTAAGGGIWRVPAAGGPPELVIEGEAGETFLRPQLLPDADHVLFTLATGVRWEEAQVVVQSLKTRERKVLVTGAVDGRYVPGGHLLFGKDGALHAIRFDAERREVSGRAVPLLTDVAQQTSAGAWGGFDYAVSPDGTLVYVPAAAAALKRQLTWVDRQGREEFLPAEPRAYQYPRLSPDKRFVALDLRDQLNDVWAWDLERATLTRVTIGRRAGGPAIWTHDARSIIFGPDISGVLNLYVQDINGGPPRRLTESPNINFADVITPDGHSLVYSDVDPQTGFDLRLLRLDRAEAPRDLLRTPFDERNAHLSPDGRWIAYQSDESGRFEVYVRPFPNLDGGRWQVSNAGGTRPLWGRDGRELFFLDASRHMIVVPVTASDSLTFDRPARLFDATPYGLEGQQRNFELSPDGKRFLMVKRVPPPADVPAVVIVQNWFQELLAKLR